MKVFIMSLALFLIFTAFLVYSSDFNLYEQQRQALKDLAEDCAAAAALCSDLPSFSKGLLAISKKSAENLSLYMIKEAEKTALFQNGSIKMEMSLYDDVIGYAGCEKYDLQAGLPSAVITLTYTGKDIFRLPFLSCNTIKRTAVYQWEK